MGRTEAIQTGVVYFQRYHCLSLSVAYRYLRKEWNTDIKNELIHLGYTVENHRYHLFFLFFISCLSRVHQTQVWIALKKVWKLLILAILA